ncbi:MAG: intein-containing RctB family protein [Patescibacteria group bacterium]|nr:intein-containing RctB family protein [Patescibacteria group bacterium]
MMSKKDFRKIDDWLWEIPKSFRKDMKVPARIYISEKMLEEVFRDQSIPQLINGTTLPGIVKYGIAMPDCHEGYSVPIGFVGAIKIPEGIISPGACGFDINCLDPNTRILLDNGTYMTIKELEKEWRDKSVNFVNLKNKSIENSNIICFLKRYNNPTIYQITIESGEKIELTEDHPIQTKTGMKEVKFLKERDFVLIYPFKGVKYQKPSSKVILEEKKYKKILKNFGKTKKGNAFSQIFNQVESRNLLHLTYDHPTLYYLLKLMGYILGDGAISFSKNGNVQIQFYGNPEDLKEIQKDIQKLGFKPSKIYSRKRNHKIITFYNTYQFSRTEYSLRNCSFGLAILLVALGVPYGLKSHKSYRVPKWIFNCPLWQKRLFLASFFGAELSKPKVLNKYNFYAPQLNMQKAKGLERNAKLFLKDIANLLKEFGIKTYSIKKVPGYQYKGKQRETSGFRLQIGEEAQNFIRFLEIINYEYNQEKRKEACLAANYLKRKLRVVEIRNKARKEIQKLYRKRGDFEKFVPQILEKYKNEYVTPQFLYHSIFKENSHGVIKKRGNPRIAFNFPSFKQYKNKYSYGKKGLVWNKIEKIEKLSYQDFVYDFTINNINHNFIANGLVVSNCGMRLLKSEYNEKEIKPYLNKLATEIQSEVPSGLGRGRKIKLSIKQINKILEEGAHILLNQGYGEKEDVENCEAGGRLDWANAEVVSEHAKNRGRDQVGTLGSGNHFLEVQKVEEIFDEKTAEVFGLFKDQIVVMIHTGSRGLGHQVCTDYLRTMIPAMQRYGIKVPDKEFACCPFNSPEGQRYFKAMAAAANYAWANRYMIAHYVRKAWKQVLGEKERLKLLYDVAHNIIKKERYKIDGKEIEVIVHRKGATRAFPPGHPEIPIRYREAGQPVIIPGSMGTASYVLVGTKEGEEAFFSTCHGAGRTMSRHQAMRRVSGQEVVNRLKSRGIIIKCWSLRGIAEEAPIAYKNIDEVVEVVHNAGLSKKVAKLTPLAVIKGE